MSHAQKNLETINNWLGWGDPENGLWFIGIEEGRIFDQKDIDTRYKDGDYGLVSDNKKEFPVATVTSQIVTQMSGKKDYHRYRNSEMWKKGSKIFVTVQTPTA